MDTTMQYMKHILDGIRYCRRNIKLKTRQQELSKIKYEKNLSWKNISEL